MKLRTVLKRGIASFLTATMLFGNSVPALAADDADVEVVSISEDEAVSEDEAIAVDETDVDETTVAEADAEETEEAFDKGGAKNPEKIEFGKDFIVRTDEAVPSQYYTFTLEKAGYITLNGKAQEGQDLVMRLFEKQLIDDMEGIIVENKFFSTETFDEEVKLNKVGLKAGVKYFLEVESANTVEAYENTIRVDFTESDMWEAEQDSEENYKLIETNTKDLYQGSVNDGNLLVDTADYYAFDVTKAGKVTIYEKGDANISGLKITLYKNKNFEDEEIKSADLNKKGKDVIKTTLKEGRYYLSISGLGAAEYAFKVKTPQASSGSKYAETGSLSMNGVGYKSLQEAVAAMTEATVYIIDLNSDLVGEKPIKLPKKPASVIIHGNGHKIVMKGSKINASCPVILDDVTIEAVHAKKEGVLVKLTVNAKLGMTVGENVQFTALSTKLNVKKDMVVNGTLSANALTADNLKLGGMSTYILGKGDKLTVKKELYGEEYAEIYVLEGFKPIALKGTASGNIVFNCEENLSDGTQVLNCSAKKIPADTLKAVFDCTDLTANHTETYLYYLSGSKACIFGEAIEFNGKEYGLWKDVVADMNAAVKEANKNKTAVSFNVVLKGNVNMAGKFALPKKGYEGLTIDGNGNSLTFTSDITLTGNLTISDDTTLIKVNRKNEKVAGKIKPGKFTYTGPQITQ